MVLATARALTCPRTERGMGLRRIGRAVKTGRGRAVLSALLLAVLSAAWLLLSGGVAAALEEGALLEGSGIHYPGGFDPNTVGEVRGTARGVDKPERGPIRFRLDSGKEMYTVLVSPSWYWEDLRTEIPEGAEVSVRGSKTLGRDMEMYIIAQEIRILSGGRSWTFRDEAGFPLWKGGRGGAGMGVGGGSGSPMLRGGPGRGSGGGAGRGR